MVDRKFLVTGLCLGKFAPCKEKRKCTRLLKRFLCRLVPTEREGKTV